MDRYKVPRTASCPSTYSNVVQVVAIAAISITQPVINKVNAKN